MSIPVPARSPAIPAGTGTALSVEAARHLTDAIRTTIGAVYVLIHQAHTGQAHLALGYDNWASYVVAEFDGMSRSRSYQLLGQHEVIAALSVAAGTDISGLVTEKVARDIKPRLAAVTEEVADRSTGVDDRDQVLNVVAEILNTTRRTDADPVNRMPSMAQLATSRTRAAGTTDLWYTPRNAVAPLLGILPPPPLRVWAHADVRGRSAIVSVLEEAGYEVLCTDLTTSQDFFSYTSDDIASMGVDVAVTNPPYSLRKRWLAHLVDLGLPFAILVPETSIGEWAYEPLRRVGTEAGLLLLNRRIAYSQTFGAKPVGNPPFSSGWICRGLLPPGRQLVLGDVPRTF